VKHAIVFVAALFATRTAFPPRAENASATRLLSTVERFGSDLDWVRRGDVPCGFLEKHANTIRTLRAEIISNDPPVWSNEIDDVFYAPVPPLRMHFRLFTVFSADALAQTNPAAAWADLHAIWILSRALANRPEAMSVRTAMFGRRVILETAKRIAGRKPEWWSEVESLDLDTPMTRAEAHDAWLTVMQLYKMIV